MFFYWWFDKKLTNHYNIRHWNCIRAFVHEFLSLTHFHFNQGFISCNQYSSVDMNININNINLYDLKVSGSAIWYHKLFRKSIQIETYIFHDFNWHRTSWGKTFFTKTFQDVVSSIFCFEWYNIIRIKNCEGQFRPNWQNYLITSWTVVSPRVNI